MHTLKDKAFRLVLKGEDALAAQNIRAFFLHQIIDPGHEFFRVDIAIMGQGEALHLLIMIMFQAMVVVIMVMMMVIMVMVVMIVVVLFGVQEIRLDV